VPPSSAWCGAVGCCCAGGSPGGAAGGGAGQGGLLGHQRPAAGNHTPRFSLFPVIQKSCRSESYQVFALLVMCFCTWHGLLQIPTPPVSHSAEEFAVCFTSCWHHWGMYQATHSPHGLLQELREAGGGLAYKRATAIPDGRASEHTLSCCCRAGRSLAPGCLW
jgi:hypothetical protein